MSEQTTKAPRQEDSPMQDALDAIWQLMYPGKTDWEYPGQVYAHLRVWIKERAEARDEVNL